MKCPECGKFLKNVEATMNGLDDVISVEGHCKKHGKVEPTDWEYSDFYPYPEAAFKEGEKS